MSVERIHLANLMTTGSKEGISGRFSFLERGGVFTLETFYKDKIVGKLLDDHPEVHVLLDSGAYSLISNAIKIGMQKLEEEGTSKKSDKKQSGSVQRSADARTLADYSYFDTKEVKDFMKNYVLFVNKYKNQLDIYVNIDVIFNPERTWENQKYLESMGIRPMPVYHFGEDIKWLKKYMDNYEYIGIGGLGQDVTKNRFVLQHGDPVFSLLEDSKQEIKTHGFAITSLDLMLRYPWYSCDSVHKDSMLLIKDCGRIRLDTIENLYYCSSQETLKTEGGHQIRRTKNLETYVTDNNGQGCWKEIKSVIRHNTMKTHFQVQTRKGYKIEVTRDHGLFRNAGNPKTRKIECCETEKITEEDRLVTLNFSEAFGNRKEIILDIERKTCQRGEGPKSMTTRKLPEKVILDIPFMEFLGLWVADGSFSSRGDNSSVGISSGIDKECTKVVRMIADRYKRNLKICTQGIDLVIGSTKLARIIQELGFGRGSKNKEIPWWVFELPRETLGAFLRGYFSGDGSAAGFYCTSVSRKLTYGILCLLNKFGISCRIKDSFDKRPKEVQIGGKSCLAGPDNCIQILGVEPLRIFQKYINFLQKRKRSQLDENIKNTSETRGPRDSHCNDENYRKVHKIENIGIKNEPVYDLEVEDGQRFYANGFLVHNSTTWVKHAAYGAILVPRFFKDGKTPDYSKTPYVISVSNLSKFGDKQRPHFTQDLSKEEVILIRNYFEEKGWTEEALGESWEDRVRANVVYFEDASDYIRNTPPKKLKVQKRFI